MKTICLDALSWNTVRDLYDAILPELGAPDGHGHNHNAIVESMVWGEINELEPPYRVKIFHTKSLPQPILDEMRRITNFFAESCAEFRVREGRAAQVSFEILS